MPEPEGAAARNKTTPAAQPQSSSKGGVHEGTLSKNAVGSTDPGPLQKADRPSHALGIGPSSSENAIGSASPGLLQKADRLSRALGIGTSSDGIADPGIGGNVRVGQAASAGNNGLTDPVTREDLILLAQTGLRGAFGYAGLAPRRSRGGVMEILRLDGTPATESDLRRLREVIRAEPSALLRRPDFFEILPRNHFDELKSSFALDHGAGDVAFRHVGMSAGYRDFLWSQSCERLSGACNPVTSLLSYRQGADIPPEDLESIWRAALRDASDEVGLGALTAEDHAAIMAAKDGRGSGKRVDAADIMGRIKALFGGVASLFGGAQTAEKELPAGFVAPVATHPQTSPPGAAPVSRRRSSPEAPEGTPRLAREGAPKTLPIPVLVAAALVAIGLVLRSRKDG